MGKTRLFSIFWSAIVKSQLSHNAMFWNPNDYSVEEIHKDLYLVFLGIPVKKSVREFQPSFYVPVIIVHRKLIQGTAYPNSVHTRVNSALFSNFHKFLTWLSILECWTTPVAPFWFIVSLSITASGKCPDPPSVANTSVSVTVEGGHEIARYTCDASRGYIAQGNNTIICLEPLGYSLWSPTTVTCESKYKEI